MAYLTTIDLIEGEQKEIRTKFNVGDKIWFISCISNVYDGSIEAVVGQEDKEKGIRIMYLFEDYGWVKEQDCFATKEEAQKECDKRNEK